MKVVEQPDQDEPPREEPKAEDANTKTFQAVVGMKITTQQVPLLRNR